MDIFLIQVKFRIAIIYLKLRNNAWLRRLILLESSSYSVFHWRKSDKS